MGISHIDFLALSADLAAIVILSESMKAANQSSMFSGREQVYTEKHFLDTAGACLDISQKLKNKKEAK